MQRMELQPIARLLLLGILKCSLIYILIFDSFTGSAKECLSELTDYGISPDMIPVDQSGTLLFEEFMKYVDERESIETISKEKADKEHDGGGSNGDKILVPTRNDGMSLLDV